MYTLAINIRSECKELLDNLLITLESSSGNVAELDSIEVLTVSGPVCIDGQMLGRNTAPTVMQRNLFLDKWAGNDG